MITSPSSTPPNQVRRRRWARLLRDFLLLPPALLYVLVEQVFWAGAKALLRQVARIPLARNIQKKLHRLHAWAVLPLFLVPELFSHAGGFWASDLLVHRAWVAALLVGIFIKGTATLMEVWIYQSCEETLLSVRWFARLHHQLMRGRDWVAERIRPIRELSRRLLRHGRGGLTRRFFAIRKLLGTKLNLPK